MVYVRWGLLGVGICWRLVYHLGGWSSIVVRLRLEFLMALHNELLSLGRLIGMILLLNVWIRLHTWLRLLLAEGVRRLKLGRLFNRCLQPADIKTRHNLLRDPSFFSLELLLIGCLSHLSLKLRQNILLFLNLGMLSWDNLDVAPYLFATFPSPMS